MTASLQSLALQAVVVLTALSSLVVSDVCKPHESVKPSKDCHDVPSGNITKPLYPKQFTVQAPGFLAFPPGPNATFRIPINTSHLTHYYDNAKDSLKYYGVFDLLPPLLKLCYNFTHVGHIIYNQLVIPQVCVCNKISVGIFKYDAFMDATYNGRETIDVEFGVGKVLTDHYIKAPGHNLWMEVATGLPIRFFQEGMGLQVYLGWIQAAPPASIMTPPKNCFDVGGCRSEEWSSPNESFQSPIEGLATEFYKYAKQQL